MNCYSSKRSSNWNNSKYLKTNNGGSENLKVHISQHSYSTRSRDVEYETTYMLNDSINLVSGDDDGSRSANNDSN